MQELPGFASLPDSRRTFIMPGKAAKMLVVGWVKRNETHNQAWGCVYAPVGWTQPTDKKLVRRVDRVSIF